MKPYDYKEIEARIQKKWEEEKPYKTIEDTAKEKVYVLGMFPYPSGEGLHVGHGRIFTASDIYARKKRMEGKNVLFPTGWDAFGLPAEEFAIKNKIHPRISTDRNINNFRRQMKMLGLSYDFDREVDTTDPAFYKWTQWIFLKLYEKGLAYESYEPINWCPSCQTGLANEDLEDGRCERCGSVIEKKKMRQWILRITDYADRLLDDLELLDKWPSWLKELQKNWIGRSEGVEIDFPLDFEIPSGDIVFASNNEGKRVRMQKLLREAGIPMTLKTPKEIGIADFDVIEDGKTLEENAQKKALALAGYTDLPVLADDTGFFIKGTEIDPVTVKRNALRGADEKDLSIEEIAEMMQKYYKNIADSHGGKIDAEWKNALCFVTPEKFIIHAEAVRQVILTNESQGKVDPYLPLRGLYISKVTGKHVLLQNEKEELAELEPITLALKKLFTPAIKVFTTRIDTLYGVTHLVLAPEHPFVSACIQRGILPNNNEVSAYVQETKKQSLISRSDNKQKTGTALGGVFAVNPASQERIPVYISDYVLPEYGTGAIMAVPAHDERDFTFAKKYNIQVKEVIRPYVIDHINAPREDKPTKVRRNVHAIVHNKKQNKFLILRNSIHSWDTVVIGGVEEGEDLIEAAKREVREETGYTNLVFKRILGNPVQAGYFAKHKDENRIAIASAVYFELGGDEQEEISKEGENEGNEVVWVREEDFIPGKMVNSELSLWLARLQKDEDIAYEGEGVLINSGNLNGTGSQEAKMKMVSIVGGKPVVRYRLQDWVFSRQRYWGEPIPMVHDENGKAYPLDESELPLLLPDVQHYEPTGTGESPLANIKEWVEVKGIITKQGTFKQDTKGEVFKRETNTMPQWAGSSWYYLRFADPYNGKELISKEKEKYWQPVDRYVGGAEHATRHLIYARFWHKFLFDIGVVTRKEPFLTMESVGLVLGPDGQKMSKRRGNVINPDDVVKDWGADTVRLYSAFMGSFYDATPWNPEAIVGCARFLERIYKIKEHTGDEHEEIERLLHKTVKKVTEDIESFKFNTAISALMIFLNAVEEKKAITSSQIKIFLQLLAPFAPHISEALWEEQGFSGNIHTEGWPSFDEAKTIDKEATITFQVNGKLRGTFTVPTDTSDEDLKNTAFSTETYAKYVGANNPKKVIIVKNRLINIVI